MLSFITGWVPACVRASSCPAGLGGQLSGKVAPAETHISGLLPALPCWGDHGGQPWAGMMATGLAVGSCEACAYPLEAARLGGHPGHFLKGGTGSQACAPPPPPPWSQQSWGGGCSPEKEILDEKQVRLEIHWIPNGSDLSRSTSKISGWKTNRLPRKDNTLRDSPAGWPPRWAGRPGLSRPGGEESPPLPAPAGSSFHCHRHASSVPLPSSRARHRVGDRGTTLPSPFGGP